MKRARDAVKGRCRNAAFAFGVSLALAAFVLGSPYGSAAEVKVVNVMPAFERAWQLGLGKPLDERVRLMKQIVFIPNEPAYDDYGQIPLDDVHIAWFLRDVDPMMPEIRATVDDGSGEIRVSGPDMEARLRAWAGRWSDAGEAETDRTDAWIRELRGERD